MKWDDVDTSKPYEIEVRMDDGGIKRFHVKGWIYDNETDSIEFKDGSRDYVSVTIETLLSNDPRVIFHQESSCTPVCECGSKFNGGFHSTWCPLYRGEG